MAQDDRLTGEGVLIAALAGGATVKDAAKQAGVSERTARRRLTSADFRRQVDDARSEIVGRSVAILARLSTEAAETLGELLGAESESVKLGACRSILELGVKLRETEDLARRLAAIEAQLDGRTQAAA